MTGARQFIAVSRADLDDALAAVLMTRTPAIAAEVWQHLHRLQPRAAAADAVHPSVLRHADQLRAEAAFADTAGGA